MSNRVLVYKAPAYGRKLESLCDRLLGVVHKHSSPSGCTRAADVGASVHKVLTDAASALLGNGSKEAWMSQRLGRYDEYMADKNRFPMSGEGRKTGIGGWLRWNDVDLLGGILYALGSDMDAAIHVAVYADGDCVGKSAVMDGVRRGRSWFETENVTAKEAFGAFVLWVANDFGPNLVGAIHSLRPEEHGWPDHVGILTNWAERTAAVLPAARSVILSASVGPVAEGCAAPMDSCDCWVHYSLRHSRNVFESRGKHTVTTGSRTTESCYEACESWTDNGHFLGAGGKVFPCIWMPSTDSLLRSERSPGSFDIPIPRGLESALVRKHMHDNCAEQVPEAWMMVPMSDQAVRYARSAECDSMVEYACRLCKAVCDDVRAGQGAGS